MKRLSWLPLMAVLMTASPAAAATAAMQATTVAAADEVAVDAFVRSIYGRYHDGSPGLLPDAAIYAPATLPLVRENRRLLRGRIGAIDADVFVDAQDYGRVGVDSILLSPRPDGRVSVAVRFSDPENDVRDKLKTLVVERTAAGWRVYDVVLPGTSTVRETLASENRRLRTRR